MLLCIPGVLTKAEVAGCRRILDQARWVDGKGTAGAQSAAVKDNEQLASDCPASREMGDTVLDALSRNAMFLSAALPLRIIPPLFSRYGPGQSFGTHVDNAIRGIPGTATRIRTDLSCTLFLSEPDEYDGGELTIESSYGAQEIKLSAGDLVLYPSTSLHCVAGITRGHRIVSFFWLQSMVRSDEDRSLLFDLDQSIQTIGLEQGLAHPSCVALSGIYHNLIRRFADV